MKLGFIFWMVMVIWIIFGLWLSGGDRYAIGGSVMEFALFFLLGWKVFGFIVQE